MNNDIEKRIIIGGKTMNPKKKAEIAIRYIYGIGKSNSVVICKKLGVLGKKVKDLTQEEIYSLKAEIETYTIEDDLKRLRHDDFKDLIDIKCARGLRRTLGLPVRGQRTSSNAKTAKKLKK